MKIGNVEVLNDGFWRSDGGAMFGVVPRVMWERKLPPDDRNRVSMALRCLLIQDHGTTILVDTGMGDKLSRATRMSLRSSAIVGFSANLPTEVLDRNRSIS